MCHVFMFRHGCQILCVISAVFVLLFRLFDDNVLGGPHLCGNDIKSLKFLRKFSRRSILFCFCDSRFKTLKFPQSGV